MINRYSKLSSLQRQILKEGLARWYIEHLRAAWVQGWNAAGGKWKETPGFDLRDVMMRRHPQLEEAIGQSYWDPYRKGKGKERRNELLAIRPAFSKSLRRLVERGLLVKVGNRNWMLTEAGYALATQLFPKLVKPMPTEKEKQAYYQDGQDEHRQALARRRRMFGF
jgi:hypothetical protein